MIKTDDDRHTWCTILFIPILNFPYPIAKFEYQHLLSININPKHILIDHKLW